ncbi:prophage tail fiber N-terminal domain and S74 family endopeptidase-containing protein [Escherichia coli]|uniref:prophage tail fiber N-terminal domain and S74 family endopeptidase-containing protein n=1 Tax=Escherichia coli TaxID=562 RepID=UPI001CD11370|nr:prophage tail fiber N-terminal domain and S74 family endopeptidase-containing protein [Escherichia coli]EFO6542771.1 phage tail protein [Escherichia coli]EJA7672339.1 prophage tail fiber N-terminal domain-containing protein [Escherichia coli]ELX1845566.1 prophage tail fiber N-terminal domain-containing protein [Escherichia coli]HCJ8778748.1 prophage tail fiber N-terminal domain-containing protein [Escherichia coli]HCP6667231.1 prophage tail fiber N-terminal domain-containing protein [Escher
MAVKISGVLKDGAGKPVQNCTIQLKAKRNSTTVVVNTVASENPDEAGRYSMDVEHGQYSVILLVEGFPPSHAGTITVYEDSQPGTLNDFLGAMTEDDARPEALRRFELMVEEVARNASAVAQDTAAAKKSASDASTSAREAATHATDAAGSARAASTSAGQAASSAQSASSSAGTASTKATEALKSAAAAESSKSAAATSAGAAKTSETNAAASQQSAATSASTATTKASEAATSARDASASKEAAKSSETSAASSASSAASSATAAGNSAKAAKTSETNADNSAQAAADSQTASANSATAAKKSETNAKNSEAAAKSSETNAKASETNAKSSETNAAKSAADALNYRNQAQVIVGDNIGLGSAPRDCPDISGNPSGYIGFMRIMSNAKGFPSIASGESSLTGFISQVDGTPAYTGVFQGWATRSLYTYRWNPTIGPQWTRHARKNEVDRLDQWNSETWLYNHDKSMRLGLTGSTWGCYSDTQKKWIPLDVSHGGTGAATIDGARTNLGLGRNNSPQLNSLFLDRYSDSTSTYTSSGILHTRLLATDSTVRLGADMYVETLSNEPGQLTIRFTYDGSTGASKYLNLNSEGNLIVDSAILKSTVEKPLQIRSANPAIRFNETDRPANTPTYTLIANAGDWFIQKRDYDDAGSVSNAIAYNFANDRIDVQNLKASGLITANSGIATLTGHDWNAQHTDNVDKFRPIAGSTNGPAGSMVLGGIHVQFSKNYAVQFGGRNSGFWGRTIENGTTQEWKKLLTVDDLNSSTDLAVRSLTTSNPVKSGGGRIDVLGSTSDYSKMDCFVRGFDSTGNSLAWALGSSVGVSKMLSLKNFFSGAEILLNGNDGAVQLKTGAVNGAKAQALTINKDEVNSTVDLTLTKQSGTGNRFVLQNSGNAELPFSVRVWGSSTRQNVFEVGTSAAYLFYAQKTSAGQLFDVNGAINCTTLNQSSDRDLKDDILVISDATKAIRKMNGYTYTLKENGMPYAGVIAQEVMEAIPEAVGSFTHYGEELQGPTVDGNELREETRYLNVDYSAVTGLLVQVARETDDRVTALEEENTTLRQNLATAGTRISTLENQVSELVALVRQLTGSEH